MEMGKEYHLKAGEITGHCQVARLQRIISEAAEYLAIKKAIDSGVHKAYGLNAREYCQDKCGIPYSTYNLYETEIRRIGKDLWIMRKLMGWGTGEIQALTALPEDSKVKIHEKGNTVEIDGKKIPLDNKHEIQEAFHAILKREELTVKEKELEQKEKKHLEKKMEGIDKEYKKELQAYEKKVADLEAKVVDPKMPEGFAEVFKMIERKSDEIFMAAARLRFDEAYKDVADEGHVRAMYQSSLKLICNRFENCIKKLEDGLGVALSV